MGTRPLLWGASALPDAVPEAFFEVECWMRRRFMALEMSSGVQWKFVPGRRGPRIGGRFSSFIPSADKLLALSAEADAKEGRDIPPVQDWRGRGKRHCSAVIRTGNEVHGRSFGDKGQFFALYPSTLGR